MTGVPGIRVELAQAMIRDELTFHIAGPLVAIRSEEHTSELQSHSELVCRLLLEKKKQKATTILPAGHIFYVSKHMNDSQVCSCPIPLYSQQ